MWKRDVDRWRGKREAQIIGNERAGRSVAQFQPIGKSLTSQHLLPGKTKKPKRESENPEQSSSGLQFYLKIHLPSSPLSHFSVMIWPP